MLCRNVARLRPVRGILACAALLGGVGCGGEKEQVFTVRGVIRGPFASGTIRVQHEEIPGYMPAMTMPFHVEERDVRGLVPGDQVEFEFRVGENSRAAKFRRIGRAPSDPGAGAAAAAVRPPMTRLRAGDRVPDFALVDQDGQPLSGADLEGRLTVISFIFTRCPVPEFCPLIMRKLKAVQDRSGASPPAGQPRILAVSIDPAHDRPAVLRAHGEAAGADFSRWRFATGETAEVDKLTRLFAVRVEPNAGTLDHTLATALIGPDRRVVEIWRGNAWKPEEVLARIADPGAPAKTDG